jgi:hypothetical protein
MKHFPLSLSDQKMIIIVFSIITIVQYYGNILVKEITHPLNVGLLQRNYTALFTPEGCQLHTRRHENLKFTKDIS